ncbi:MAG: hypothetical protein Q4G64_07630 [bacterium]|nr:hypothetical protein [bacterium]
MGLRQFAAALGAVTLALGMSACGGETKVRETAGAPVTPSPVESVEPEPGPETTVPEPGPETTPPPEPGPGPTSPGGDYGLPADEVEYLDGLWDACEAGDMEACDELYMESPLDSHWEEFGNTCGGTDTGEYWCGSGPVTPGGETSGAGEDPSEWDLQLQQIAYDACAAGDGYGCERLGFLAEPGSEESAFGLACGNPGSTDGPFCVDEQPMVYGESQFLDALQDGCLAGEEGRWCNALWLYSPVDSEYEQTGLDNGGL